MKYFPELEVNKAKPIRFEGYKLEKRQQLVSNNYNHTWALASFRATPEEIKTNIDDENLQTVEQQNKFEEQVLALRRLSLPKVKTHNLQTNLSYQFQLKQIIVNG